MIRATIFTYRGDEAETIECLRCAKMSMPDAVFSIVDDASDPVDIETVAVIVAEGASYRQSDFPRNKNLNGVECVRGILAELTRDVDPNDVVVKIDPDTAILDAEWLCALNNSVTVYVSSGDDHVLVYGCTYAMTGRAAIMARDVANTTDLQGRCPEDDTIAMIIYNLFTLSSMILHRPWTLDKPTPWTAFNWQSMTATPEDYVLNNDFAVVITGSPRNPNHQIQSRADCIRRLRLTKWSLSQLGKFQIA